MTEIFVLNIRNNDGEYTVHRMNGSAARCGVALAKQPQTTTSPDSRLRRCGRCFTPAEVKNAARMRAVSDASLAMRQGRAVGVGRRPQPVVRPSTVEGSTARIRNRVAFDAGNLKGFTVHPTGRPSFGRAPASVKNAVTEALADGKYVYLVTSYGTVIAYAIGKGKLTVPEVKYTQTTSKHQTYARRSI